MLKQNISSDESTFLSWVRSLSPESQECLYEGVVTDELPQALASVAGEELHSFLKIPAPISFENDSLFVGEFNFFADLVASPGQNI